MGEIATNQRDSKSWRTGANLILLWQLRMRPSLGMLLLFFFLLPIVQTYGRPEPHQKLTSTTKLVLPIDSTTNVLFYYGSWNDDLIFRAQDFRVVVLEPSQMSAAQIQKLRAGHDGILGTNDDVIVIGYLSIGEDTRGDRTGNGCGPCYYNYDSSKVIYENKGYASWYVDDRDLNSLPDEDSLWGSYYVNGGDTLWWQFLKTNSDGTDAILAAKGCDGLFLDMLDTASPWYPWPYRWEVDGMSALVQWLRQMYPTKYLIANRGLFYFDPTLTDAYAHTIRPYIDADLYESYFNGSDSTDRAYWAAKLNTEGQKPDGFKVMALDYFDPSQTSSINQQIQEVFSYNWGDYIKSFSSDSIRYYVFHRSLTNPPTWDSPIGVTNIQASDKSATLQWGTLTDPSLPLKFNIYYSMSLPLDTSSAVELKDVNAVYNSNTNRYSFTVTGLNNFTTYYFLVRAVDARGNFEKNFSVLSATPPNKGSSQIIIDGNFNDWQGITPLNAPPNPAPGYSPDSDADFINFWATNDTSNLYLSYQLAGIIDPSKYYYHIFIDVDDDLANGKTGYVYNDSALTGAEYLIENSSFDKYDGTGGEIWSWTASSGMEKADSADRTELSIPLNVLFQNDSNNIVALFFQINQASSPYATMDVAPENYKTQCYIYQIKGTVTSVGKQGLASPSRYSLSQNYPNPFNPTTDIQYELPKRATVKIMVYDVLGQKISTIVNEVQDAGAHVVRFNGANLSSGVYFYLLQTENFVSVRKMLLLK